MFGLHVCLTEALRTHETRRFFQVTKTLQTPINKEMPNSSTPGVYAVVLNRIRWRSRYQPRKGLCWLPSNTLAWSLEFTAQLLANQIGSCMPWPSTERPLLASLLGRQNTVAFSLAEPKAELNRRHASGQLFENAGVPHSVSLLHRFSQLSALFLHYSANQSQSWLSHLFAGSNSRLQGPRPERTSHMIWQGGRHPARGGCS